MDTRPLITSGTEELTLPAHGDNNTEYHALMGDVLTNAIATGHKEIPDEIAPLVCKPKQMESWRIFRIMSEFVEGFELIRKYATAATFFGSARTKETEHYYQEASALAGRLAKQGFAVMTGGSGGIMEAANKGAHDAGGASIGLNIRLSSSQASNTYLTDFMMFDHFFVRKTMLAFASEVYVFFPGGFGTFDELFEILTLIQTKKIRKIPVVLYGKQYWSEFETFIKKTLLEEFKTIDQSDLDLFVIVDSTDEAIEYITKNVTC